MGSGSTVGTLTFLFTDIERSTHVGEALRSP
jgi:hypothetical protein